MAKLFKGQVFHRLTSIRKPYPSFLLQSLSTNSNPDNSACLSEKSQQERRISLANLLQRYGFPPSRLENFLAKNRFLLAWNPSGIQKALGFLSSSILSQKVYVSLIYNCPNVLDFEFLKKWEVGMSELGALGASSSMIGSVIQCSGRNQINPDDLSKSVRVLKGFGLSDATVARVLEEFPSVMMVSEGELWRKVKFLIGIGIPRSGLDRIFYSFPGIVRLAVEDRLKPLLDEFTNSGFSEDLVRNEIFREPRILGLQIGQLSSCLDFLGALKCKVPIKERIMKKGAFRAAFEVILRVNCLCRHGLIHGEAFKVLWKEPRAIVYAVEDIEEKIEFLIHRMKFDIGWLVEVPEYLGMNMEKQIVPRYNVIEYLRSKGGLGVEVDLKDLVKLSRLRFYNFYVKPYPECQKIFPLSKDVGLKNQHPQGLWKLLKPQVYKGSREDVKNVKSFMEALV